MYKEVLFTRHTHHTTLLTVTCTLLCVSRLALRKRLTVSKILMKYSSARLVPQLQDLITSGTTFFTENNIAIRFVRSRARIHGYINPRPLPSIVNDDEANQFIALLVVKWANNTIPMLSKQRNRQKMNQARPL